MLTKTMLERKITMYIAGPTGLVALMLLVIIAMVIIARRRKNSEDWKWKKQFDQDREKVAEEERKRLIPQKILVTEEQFNALSEVSIKIQKLVNRLCYDERFIRYVHENHDHTNALNNGEDMYIHYMHDSLHDILWVFDRLGCLCDHSAEISEMLKCCRIDFETKKGHCLLIISETMSHINYDSPYSYFDYQRTVGDPESLFFEFRQTKNTSFDTFVHYNPSIGQEDYKICDLIGNYSEEDKQLYRNLMYRLGTTVAEILVLKAPSESEWIVKNDKGNNPDTSNLEKVNDSYEVPMFKSKGSFLCEDDETDSSDDFYSDYGFTEIAEITYTFIGSDAPKDKFEMEFSEKDADRLKEAEQNVGVLDSNYISKNLKSIHRKILRGICEDLEAKSGDPHDGMIQVHHPPAYHAWEKVHDSHQDLLDSFSNDAVEYEVEFIDSSRTFPPSRK